jgi:cysteine desulfurase
MRAGNTIYLDHQATTPIDERVLAAMLPYFREQFGNPHSADHAFGWTAARATEAAAARVASLIGADAGEIIFTSGATESNNLAILGCGQDGVSSTRSRVLVSAIEHKSVLASARESARRFGYTVDHIPVDANGVVDLPALEGMLSADVLLVSVAFVNSEIGSIQPLQRIAEMAARHGALFHTDCAQAPGAVDMDSLAQTVDMASLSGHKMYGPKGVGALYVRNDLQSQIRPLIYGGGQQGGMRAGTLPVPLCVGMGVAATLAASPLLQSSLRRKRDRLLEGLRSLPRPAALNGPGLDNRHPGNANVRFEGFVAQDILAALQPKLAASTGSACTSGTPEPSHVLKAIGLTTAQAEASIRFSVGRFTTDEEIDEAVNLVRNTLESLTGSGAAEAI